MYNLKFILFLLVILFLINTLKNKESFYSKINKKYHLGTYTLMLSLESVFTL